MIRYNGEYCEFLSAISNRDAFAMVVAILENGPLTEKEISEYMGLTKKTIKQHLKRLVSCGYILPKSSRPPSYNINKAIVVPLIQLMNIHISRHSKRARR